MDVEDSFRKGLDKSWAEQAHEPGQADQMHPMALELGDQRLVVGLARPVGRVLEHRCLDARPTGPLETTRVRVVGNDDRNGRDEMTVSHRVDDRLEVATPTRNQHTQTCAVAPSSYGRLHQLDGKLNHVSPSRIIVAIAFSHICHLPRAGCLAVRDESPASTENHRNQCRMAV